MVYRKQVISSNEAVGGKILKAHINIILSPIRMKQNRTLFFAVSVKNREELGQDIQRMSPSLAINAGG